MQKQERMELFIKIKRDFNALKAPARGPIPFSRGAERKEGKEEPSRSGDLTCQRFLPKHAGVMRRFFWSVFWRDRRFHFLLFEESFNSFRAILQIGLEVTKERRAMLTAADPAKWPVSRLPRSS